MRVLLIEDDPVIAANVRDYLGALGMSVECAPDGAAGLDALRLRPPGIVVLDLNLPGIDGIDLCRRVRGSADGALPILMLTARDSLESKRVGFEAGADDYLVKPFVLDELALRIRALARRAGGRLGTVRAVGAMRMERDARRVTVADRPVRLTPRSFQLVELLMSDPDRVFSRGELEREIWGEHPPGSDALRALVAQTRRAFGEAAVDPIENLHGHGYRLRPPDAVA
ncbi:MAG TPA: response regulator transcription factor [Burkholderiaceae bacterium]|nr:response regulator transcription factor [Burkholderiaceae bacterium]